MCGGEGIRDVQCPAKYVQLFSMPLMGHISLGALCLLPNCKRYLTSHLQEIPRCNDSSSQWSPCSKRIKVKVTFDSCLSEDYIKQTEINQDILSFCSDLIYGFDSSVRGFDLLI